MEKNMKDLKELEHGVKTNPELREKFMEIMQFIYVESQENLVRPVPWGDEFKSSTRSPTTITDTSALLLSGIPPYWDDDNRIVFEYAAPHAENVEYGSPPHAVSAKRLMKWTEKKLRLKGKASQRAAYAVANKIKKEGIDPHPYIRPAIYEAERKFKLKLISRNSFV